MRQYRVTAEHFNQPAVDDAVMDTEDLRRLKQLAGLMESDGGAPGPVNSPNDVPNSDPGPSMSPVGSNISITAAHRNELLRKYHARPGDELWFLINFDEVRGPPANNGTLEQKIIKWIKDHPEERYKHVSPNQEI